MLSLLQCLSLAIGLDRLEPMTEPVDDTGWQNDYFRELCRQSRTVTPNWRVLD